MRDPQSAHTNHPDRTALHGGVLMLRQHEPPSSSGQTQTVAQPSREISAESFLAAGLAHDARNLLSAIHLYCELLADPGVLAPGFRHYASDLRRVGETGARLIEALAGAPSLPSKRSSFSSFANESFANAPFANALLTRARFPPIDDVGAEVSDLEDLLRALVGPGVRVEIEAPPCAGAIGLNSEELLRILFNLVANAVEALHGKAARRSAFPEPGLLRITVQRGEVAGFLHAPGRHRGTVVISVRDNGPGIASADLARIFDLGFSTRPADDDAPSDVPLTRGLGLAIVRQLVESVGGAVRAVSAPGSGTRFDIELPLLASLPLGESEPARLRAEVVPPEPEKKSTTRNAGNRKISSARLERRVQC